ncbi:hypothetical protein GCM10010145_20160 [Streptomyces ruber]|uniref:Uncharacterized protein n=2 Tax=Streptomyces TaxID=1883 RepID=A0A918ES36_9ACTN|nr:hypothetical protein [Streptomyces ruber]GGQ50997.1 hypothetical protein GCM10010145_20160 [Streptomyces ruber]
MAKSPAVRATAPDSVWLARGRHTGSPAEELVRRRLAELKSAGVIQDHLEFDGPDETPGRHVFEARWLVDGDIVVRARLTVGPPDGADGAREWVLAAEAEWSWKLDWPSPATVFWPGTAGDTADDAAWDQDVVPGLRLRAANRLPADEKQLRRLLRDCARHSGNIHVVVHEAMTPDERGLRPLTPMLPPGLRHRVVEHRAAPDQFQVVNWALGDLGVRLPRGGAVVLPGTPARPGHDAEEFAVRTVFLDGSEPTELIDTVVRYAALPEPLSAWAEEAVTELREQWHLLTVEEELDHARRLVAAYAEALEAMTKSRDLYREAADRAHEALAVYREEGHGPVPAPREEPRPRERFSLRTLTKSLERARAGHTPSSGTPGPGPGGEGVKEST